MTNKNFKKALKNGEIKPVLKPFFLELPEEEKAKPDKKSKNK
jgi:hypothetical protein